MQMLQTNTLKRIAKTAWSALFFISGNDGDPTDRWRFRRKLIYGTYRVSVFMILFGAVTFFFDTQVSNTLVISGTSMLSIIVSAYVAGATIDDKIQKDVEP